MASSGRAGIYITVLHGGIWIFLLKNIIKILAFKNPLSNNHYSGSYGCVFVENQIPQDVNLCIRCPQTFPLSSRILPRPCALTSPRFPHTSFHTWISLLPSITLSHTSSDPLFLSQFPLFALWCFFLCAFVFERPSQHV